MATPFATPVVLLTFNRPAETAAAVAAIRAVRPSRLLIVADGPRPGREDDIRSCAAARAAAQAVDWPCVVETNQSPTNLGCRRRVASGLDWVFTQVTEAVIVEDDCLPDPSFFHFCTELLARHRDDPAVMSICGHRCDGPDEPDGPSYVFSRYPSSWGWATWRRAWRLYDPNVARWPCLRATDWLEAILGDPAAVAYWRRTFDHAAAGVDTWDHAWLFAHWLHQAVAIRPRVNLVRNIGFGPHATHTHDASHPLAARPAAAMPFPLRHPREQCRDEAFDRRLEWVLFSGMQRRALAEAHRRIHEARGADDLPFPHPTA
jgi:hypothetical protein